MSFPPLLDVLISIVVYITDSDIAVYVRPVPRRSQSESSLPESSPTNQADDDSVEVEDNSKSHSPKGAFAHDIRSPSSPVTRSSQSDAIDPASQL